MHRMKKTMLGNTEISITSNNFFHFDCKFFITLWASEKNFRLTFEVRKNIVEVFSIIF